MKQKLFIFSLFVLLYSKSFSQSADFDVVPKQYSFELGAAYMASSTFTNAPKLGYGVMFDVGWKVQGFIRKSPVYLTVPIGYMYYPASSASEKTMKRMNYGWTVRHDLGRDKKVFPFLGYSLLLNSLSFDGVEGRVMGHQTKFDFGYNFGLSEKMSYLTKIEYTYMTFPHLGGKADRAHQFELKAGVRF